MDENEKYYTSLGMRMYGGSFVKALGHAIARADPQNRAKIKEAFPEYCEKYYEMGKELSDADPEKWIFKIEKEYSEVDYKSPNQAKNQFIEDIAHNNFEIETVH